MISMRPTRRMTTRTAKLTATAACALALAMTLATAPVRAEEEVSFDTKIMRGLLEGLGLKRDGEAGINYQERAPLVIPPGRDLPPPERGDAAIANNPAWPKDPDVSRRKEAARLERNRNVSEEREIEQNPLRPDQITPGGNPRTPPSRRTTSTNLGQDGERMSPSELGYKGGIFSSMFGGDKEEAVRFTGEPPRASLTEPPPGYQTPSPDQPYGAGKAAAPKATDYIGTKGELGR
jgi:hypothetical protein